MSEAFEAFGRSTEKRGNGNCNGQFVFAVLRKGKKTLADT